MPSDFALQKRTTSEPFTKYFYNSQSSMNNNKAAPFGKTQVKASDELALQICLEP